MLQVQQAAWLVKGTVVLSALFSTGPSLPDDTCRDDCFKCVQRYELRVPVAPKNETVSLKPAPESFPIHAALPGRLRQRQVFGLL